MINPWQPFLWREAMHWGTVRFPPRVLTEHLKWWEEVRKASCFTPKGRFQEKNKKQNMGTVRSREKRRRKGRRRRRVLFFLDREAESNKDLPTAFWSGIPWRGVTTEKRSNRIFHWSAQEMRTGVWPSSFFWVSGKLRWPLKGDEESAQSLIQSRHPPSRRRARERFLNQRGILNREECALHPDTLKKERLKQAALLIIKIIIPPNKPFCHRSFKVQSHGQCVNTENENC